MSKGQILVFSWPKKILLAFFLGVLTFTPWQILMARLRVVEFPQIDFWGIPWWIPPTFGLTVAGGVVIFTIGDRLLRVRPQFNPNLLALEYLLISGFYLAIFFFRQYPYPLSLSLLFIVIVRLIFFHESLDILYFLLGACLGPTIELVLTSIGIYYFTEPDFLGMPYWLPIFWGNVALAVRRVAWILATPKRTASAYEIKFGG